MGDINISIKPGKPEQLAVTRVDQQLDIVVFKGIPALSCRADACICHPSEQFLGEATGIELSRCPTG
jgi:hypothetical protein